MNNAGVLLSNHRRLNNQKVIYSKFVDDLTLCEAIDLQTKLTGKTIDGSADSAHYVLPIQQTEMNKQVENISKYAIENDIKVNYSKTKIMTFNPCKSLEFDVNMSMDGHILETVEESKHLRLFFNFE